MLFDNYFNNALQNQLNFIKNIKKKSSIYESGMEWSLDQQRMLSSIEVLNRPKKKKGFWYYCCYCTRENYS